MFHFYALPTWALGPPSKNPKAPRADPLVPSIATDAEVVSLALGTAEFAGLRAATRAERAMAQGAPSAIFAQPPNDLPALLRLADELVSFAWQDRGVAARIWQCECGTRYGVPVAVLVPMSVPCEKCGRQIDLEPQRSVGEDHLTDPLQARVNAYRGALAEFFREAMFRGWPVLVKRLGP